MTWNSVETSIWTRTCKTSQQSNAESKGEKISMEMECFWRISMAVNPDGILRKSQQVPARQRQIAYTLPPHLLTRLIHKGKKWCISISWREIKGNRWALTVIHNKTSTFLNNPTKTHSKWHHHMTTQTHLMDRERRNLVDCSFGGVAIHQIPQTMKIRHRDIEMMEVGSGRQQAHYYFYEPTCWGGTR